jgi:predicted amidophosphoribosyltransferase
MFQNLAAGSNLGLEIMMARSAKSVTMLENPERNNLALSLKYYQATKLARPLSKYLTAQLKHKANYQTLLSNSLSD